MHTGAFAAAGQRLADTDDSFSSAPRGILIGQIPQILRAKKFDGTRGGQRLDIWLEEIDKAIIVNPDVFRQWKGDATDRSIAEQSLPRKLADLAQVVVNNLSMRSGSASNVRSDISRIEKLSGMSLVSAAWLHQSCQGEAQLLRVA